MKRWLFSPLLYEVIAEQSSLDDKIQELSKNL